MKWLDIVLPDPASTPVLAAAATRVRKLVAEMPRIQERDGLDAASVVDRMAAAGLLLFQAVRAVRPGAFDPDETDGTNAPTLGDPDHDDLVGYQFVVPAALLDLPWSWLHTGVGFALDKHPICWGTRRAGAARSTLERPWMERLQRARYLVDEDGGAGLAGTLSALRQGVARPEILFVAGHSEDAVRRLIRREGEVIAGALDDTRWGEPLANLHLDGEAPTPTRLREQALAYQAIHFAGPTSRPAADADKQALAWLDRLLAEAMARSDDEVDEMAGLEAKLAGVDQVTAVLDMVAERYAQRGASGRVAPPVAVASAPHGATWLLDDGPVDPEGFAHGPGLPPLVVSNCHCGLPELGGRFLTAGASTFVGPLLPLYSRPARLFAGHCWRALAAGWCAGAAVWSAARALRRELGPEHPAWLSYGLQGNGLLALQYL